VGLTVISSSAGAKVRAKPVISSCVHFLMPKSLVKHSLDGNVYIWQRDTGVLLEVLTGHGEGSVNSVAWNPTNERMFASCSDDHSIRIWEPAPSGVALSSSPMMDHPPTLPFVEKGKGKTRQRVDNIDGDPADPVDGARL
jgi:WD repeat-containing protein 26